MVRRGALARYRASALADDQRMAALVVEDDPLMRTLLSEILAMRGHRVEACATAEVAAELCQQGSFSLILLDWHLPGMDGLELCRELRRRWLAPEPYVLLVTYRDDVGDADEAAAAGVDDYLVKPFGLDELMERLRVAERRAVRRAGPAARQPTPSEVS
jgi:OmpR-family two-component system manganese-sensing response regulator